MAVTDWSNPCWDMIHVSAHKLATNPARVQALWSHIRALCNVLPCPICRMHAQSTIGTLSRPIRTQTDISVAMWQFHNSVNKKVGNPHFTWKQYVERYGSKDPGLTAVTFSKQMLHIVAMTRSSSTLSSMPEVVNSFASWVHQSMPPRRKKHAGARRVTMNFMK